MTPLPAWPARSAASIALSPAGGSYCAMIVPRPGWLRQRTMRSTMAVSMASSASAAPTAPVIAAADAPNDSSRGSKVPSRNATANERFSNGPSAAASATTAGGSTTSESHGRVDPLEPR